MENHRPPKRVCNFTLLDFSACHNVGKCSCKNYAADRVSCSFALISCSSAYELERFVLEL